MSEILDTSLTFARPNKAENTDPRTNYAVKYATARGHLMSYWVECKLVVFSVFVKSPCFRQGTNFLSNHWGWGSSPLFLSLSGLLRWPSNSQRRFARIDPREAIRRKIPVFIRFEQFASNLQFAIFSPPKRDSQKWESAKVSHKRVFALLTPDIHSYELAQMLQSPVFALPGCQRMSVNSFLCDTLGLAEKKGSS